MDPIPIKSTETLASWAEDRRTGAAQTRAANKTGLTTGHDGCLAIVDWFDLDTVRDAASASVVGMVDRCPMTLSFEAALVGRPTAPGAGSFGLWSLTNSMSQRECLPIK